MADLRVLPDSPLAPGLEKSEGELILIGKIGDQRIYASPDEIDMAEARRKYRQALKSPYLAAVLALQVMGYTRPRIAEMLGLATSTVHKILYRGRKFGGINDVTDRMDLEAVPLAVENTIAGLHQGDKDYTLEVLKGRGVLKAHQQVKQEGGPADVPSLVVRFEDAQGQAVTVAAGAIHGTPRAPKVIGAGSTSVPGETGGTGQ